MADIKQGGSGDLAVYSDQEGITIFHAGGAKTAPKGGATATLSTQTGNTYRVPYTFKIGLTTGNILTAAAASIQNLTGTDLLVGETKIVTTTAQTATLVAAVGIGSNSSVFGNNLIDTARVEAASAIVNNITDVGSNGKSRQIWANNNWLTCTLFSNTANTFTGNLYVTVEKS